MVEFYCSKDTGNWPLTSWWFFFDDVGLPKFGTSSKKISLSGFFGLILAQIGVLSDELLILFFSEQASEVKDNCTQYQKKSNCNDEIAYVPQE